MNTDPRQTIANSPMSTLQIVAVALTIGLNALDGFDVLSMSFASPGILKEWGLTRAALGIVLSMELIGMAAGSLFLGGVADRIGRRPTMLGCLVVMAGGMFMVTTTTSLVELSLWRVVTGLGIGGMLAAINAVAAEHSNARRRNLSVALMAIGYPVGAVVGGLIVAQLLKDGGNWRSIFYFGSAVTAAFIPLVYFFVPETVSWLAQKRPENALDQINRVLKRMGHAVSSALPVIAADAKKKSIVDLFAPGLLGTTVLVSLAYFTHITTFYYILKWVPQIVVDMGFQASQAAGVLVWANVGGALGGAAVGLLTQKFSLKALTMIVLLLSAVTVNVFGRGQANLHDLSMICAVVGFCTNGAIVGLYAIFAQVFPTHVRASGTGFAIGTGRGGSVLASIIAGYLFTAGLGLQTVSSIMAMGSLLALVCVIFLKIKPESVTSQQ
ncbi:MAG: MFS transporter [Pseudomonadota bacterium]